MESKEEEVKLLLAKPSPFSMSCAIALREKGVEFEEVEEILTAKSELLLRSNPVYELVPVLIHNGKHVAQSLVILEYIEEAWLPSETRPSLLPGSAYDRSLSRFWADFANKKILDTGLGLLKLVGEDHATARKEAVEHFLTLENGMRATGSEGPFFLGEKMSLVDVMLAPLVPWFLTMEALGELKFPGPEKCGRIYKWLATMREHPSVAASVPPSDWLRQEMVAMRRYIVEHFPGGIKGKLPQQ
jgi:glutathione S-transferase